MSQKQGEVQLSSKGNNPDTLSSLTQGSPSFAAQFFESIGQFLYELRILRHAFGSGDEEVHYASSVDQADIFSGQFVPGPAIMIIAQRNAEGGGLKTIFLVRRGFAGAAAHQCALVLEIFLLFLQLRGDL